jgi:hypothetical protein
VRVVEHHGGHAAERLVEGAPAGVGIGTRDHGETVLGGEGEQAVGEQLLGLGELGQRQRGRACVLDVDSRTVGESGVDIGLGARPQDDVERQDGVPCARRGAQQVGDGAQRRFQPSSG